NFNTLQKHTNIPTGDIVRNFRQAIQLCRQLKKVCHGYESFTQVLDQCLLIVNRDEMNAQAQLQAFTGIKKSTIMLS
ncbi:MAG TPA: hypothetical protein PLR86_02795, partial [Planctomycetota bacterium]|nr:hypothetical protein [Planctomycetota bacterium]